MPKRIPAAIAIAASAMLCLPAFANDLETTCEDVTTAGYVCATALDFGGQAAHLRTLFLGRHHGTTPGGTSGGSTITASSSGTASATTGMFSLGAQVTSGNFSGNMQALVLGADKTLAGGSFLGVMLQLGQSEVTAPASPRVTRREVLIGPYLGADLGGGAYLDGYLLYGQPDYTVANVPAQGETVTGALTVSKALQDAALNPVLYASVAAKWEQPTPATRIDATILTLGGSIRSEDRRIAHGWRQNFARFELDIGRYSDNLGTGTISYAAPRLAVGTDIAFDNNAVLNLSANASLASDQTRILALQAAYRLQF